MRRLVLALMALALAGCAVARAPQPAPAPVAPVSAAATPEADSAAATPTHSGGNAAPADGSGGAVAPADGAGGVTPAGGGLATAPLGQTTAPGSTVVPAPEVLCRKWEDGLPLKVLLAEPEGDRWIVARTGWAISRPNLPLQGAIAFPGPVNPAQVHLRVEPEAYWVAQKAWAVGAPPNLVHFRFVPRGAPQKASDQARSRPGWIYLTVLSARDEQGTELIAEPATLKIFAYDEAMAARYPYLPECYASLESKLPAGRS